jgi:uncharacterized protein (DUF1330 family)
MPVWIVATITIHDEALWSRYVAGVAATFGPYGGELLLRAAKAVPLAGQAHGDRVVVARLADMDALRRWHDSAEYQALIALRDAAADVVLTDYQD